MRAVARTPQRAADKSSKDNNKENEGRGLGTEIAPMLIIRAVSVVSKKPYPRTPSPSSSKRIHKTRSAITTSSSHLAYPTAKAKATDPATRPVITM